MTGYLGRAISKSTNEFKNQFIKLDTRTGRMNIFEEPFSKCIEEHELRFAKVITDLDIKNSANKQMLEEEPLLNEKFSKGRSIIGLSSAIPVLSLLGRRDPGQITDGSQWLELNENLRPFAVHNGGTLFLFCAPDQTAFQMWIAAFQSL